MHRLAAIMIDACVMGAIWVPLYLLCKRVTKKKESGLRSLLVVLFGLYLAAVFSVTGVPGIASLHFEPNVHFLLFEDAGHGLGQYLKNSVLNILLFVPLGCLAPMLWSRFCSARAIALLGFSCSVLIEFSQLFNFRATDVDDLLMNTIGALLGYLLFAAAARRYSACLRFAVAEPAKAYREFAAIFFCAAALMFFLVPYLTGEVWLFFLG